MIACVAGLAALGAMAPAALALVPPEPVTTSAPTPTNQEQATFDWADVDPDDGLSVIRYEGGVVVDPLSEPDGQLGLFSVATLDLPEGVVVLRVRAVQQGLLGLLDQPGPYATSGALLVDRTRPTASDLVAPAPPQGQSLAVVNTARPTFAWTAAADAFSPAVSQLARYEVQVTGGGLSDEPVVTADDETTTAAPSADLPVGPTLTWRVVAYDAAGNASASEERRLRVDLDQPAPPTIVAGPQGPTRDTTPTFTWTGAGPTFLWSVTRAGAATAAQGGETTAPDTQRTLAPLADGAYSFTLVQRNLAGTTSAVVNRPFTVDTVAPGPLTVTSRPDGPTTSPTPAFAWTGLEPGAVSTWEVIGSGGARAQGPATVVDARAAAGPLSPGSYAFQVRQVDAAGNAGPATMEPFTVLAAPAVEAPIAKPKRAAKLPAQNARRLRPRIGFIARTTRPVLRWNRGPRRTTVYNVQVFRVLNPRAQSTAAVRLVKMRSVFPRGTQVRVAGLKRGQCYVWRVWPYTGDRFTKKALGVSNFCIARRPSPK